MENLAGLKALSLVVLKAKGAKNAIASGANGQRSARLTDWHQLPCMTHGMLVKTASLFLQWVRKFQKTSRDGHTRNVAIARGLWGPRFPLLNACFRSPRSRNALMTMGFVTTCGLRSVLPHHEPRQIKPERAALLSTCHKLKTGWLQPCKQTVCQGWAKHMKGSEYDIEISIRYISTPSGSKQQSPEQVPYAAEHICNPLRKHECQY